MRAGIPKIVKGEGLGFMMELPKYQMPNLKDIALGLWQRAAAKMQEAVKKAETAVGEKKYDEARQSLGKLPVASLFTTSAAKPLREVEKNDIVLELAALLNVRLGLDDGKTPVAEIRKQLDALEQRKKKS